MSVVSLLGLDVSVFHEITFLGNTLADLLVAVGLFVAFFIGLKIFKTIILKHLERLVAKTSTDLDDRFVAILENISSLFYWFLAFYLTVKTLNVQEFLEEILDGLFIILIIWEAIKIAQNLIEYGFRKVGRGDSTALHGIKLIVRITLWVIGLLLILSNLGFDITTLAASLGIGGVAVALAAQNILGDLFASFTIYFDKPFQIGDYIIIGEHSGIVKKIGLKTTRVQTLQGEELVISNKELTEARVQNFKKLKRRRVVFGFGVTYDTPLKKLKAIPELVRDIVAAQETAEVDRVHFKEFGDFSLNFEVAYYVNTNEYIVYMDTQQAINFALAEAFEKQKIEFAFPTQTLYVKKEN